MVIGVGVDITEIERVEKACKRDAFLKRCYTEKEIQAFQGRPASLAGNFAVKEAVSKVFGTGFRGFGPRDIEVLRDGLGKPYVNLYGKAEEVAQGLGIGMLHVSISNTRELAIAIAVGSERDELCFKRCGDEKH